MSTHPFTVLILCTGNSARSIMAEFALNARGAGRFRAFSAGSRPTGAPNPFAVAQLRAAGIDASGARSKSWDEFAGPDAPALDLVVTLCDSTASETCPYWPGAPLTVHWGLPDPAAATGSDAEIAQAFKAAFGVIDRRLSALCVLPSLDVRDPQVKRALQQIGAIT